MEMFSHLKKLFKLKPFVLYESTVWASTVALQVLLQICVGLDALHVLN